MTVSVIAYALIHAHVGHPIGRQVAITIDDLPFVGAKRDYATVYQNTQRLLGPIRAAHVPVVGFVIGGGALNLTREQQARVYKCWLDSGCELGNHTWTHADLDKTPITQYEGEIMQTDAYLRELLGGISLRYFRSPYLNDGKDLNTKTELRRFMKEQGYVEAPVTFDSDEYFFATVYDRAVDSRDAATERKIEKQYIAYWLARVEFFEQLSNQVFGRECAQVLLIHSNRLNAKLMPEILQLFKKRSYSFVSLNQALRDPAYRRADNYYGSGGISWLYRWALGTGIPLHYGPTVPDWVKKQFVPK